MLFSLLFIATAHAVPVQLMHQGRLLDGDDLPMEGDLDIIFRLTDADIGGSTVWEETVTVSLTNGFYEAVLGGDEVGAPLDTSVLDEAPLWLELQLVGEGAMFPRHPITSVPYARIAGVAEEVWGGVVDASEVRIAGETVIDEDGIWVGTTPAVDWLDVSGTPEGFADGVDADALGDLVCVDDEIVRWDDGWTCSTDDTPVWDDIVGTPEGFADGVDDDTQLSEIVVEGYITDAAIDLASGTTLGGADISTGTHTATIGWAAIGDMPLGFYDGVDDDTQLSESDVEEFVTNDALDLAEGTTVGGVALATGAGVPSGVIVMWSGSPGALPEGWALCDGADGRPDLRNRFVRSIADAGEEPGVVGGSDSTALTEAQMPSHGHGVTDPGHGHATTRVCASGPTTGLSGVVTASACGSLGTSHNTTGISLADAGSGSAIDNRPAFYTLAFIIKL